MDQSQSGSDKSKKIVKIANRQNEVRDELTEQVTETIFSRIRMVKRGACSRPDSDTSDSEIQQIEWRTVNRYIKPKGQRKISSASPVATKFISFWDPMDAEKSDNPKNMLELEARTVMENNGKREQDFDTNSQGDKPSIVEVDLTAERPSESPEVSMIGKKKITHNSRKNDFCQAETNRKESLDNLTKLFDRSLLAELIYEDPWTDRLRRVIERNDRNSFELMGPYTNRRWMIVY